VKETPSAPSELVPEIPARLSALILKLLEKHRDHRPQSADEVARELDSVLRELPPPPEPPSSTPVDTFIDSLAQQETLGIQMASVETRGPSPRPRSTSAPRIGQRRRPPARKDTSEGRTGRSAQWTGKIRRSPWIAGAALLVLVGAMSKSGTHLDFCFGGDGETVEPNARPHA